MKIKFIGAVDNHVTGSCTLFSYDRKKVQFLVDCGLYQGETHAPLKNRQDFPFKPSDIKFVLLTHAHIDHCGLIPKLYRDGFQGSVFCTTATAELARLSLLDSVRFSDDLYTENDVKKIRFNCVDQRPDFGLSRNIPIDDDLFVSFTRTAHILGAMSLKISWLRDDESRGDIVMSGDLGNNTKENSFQPLLAGRQEPFGVPEYMVVESTYGSRDRDPSYSSYSGRLEALAEVIKDAALNRSKILIPAFSLQRTQEILMDMVCVLESSDLLPAEVPYMPLFAIDEYVTKGWWESATNGRIQRALEAYPEDYRERWSDAVEISKYSDDDQEKFTFTRNARVSFEDFRTLMRGYTKPLALKVDLDSPLTLKMTGVFSEELCRKQRNNPEETLYRNRNMAERLNVESEIEVDKKIRNLFPKNPELNAIDISIGNHELRYRPPKTNVNKNFKSKKPINAVKESQPPPGNITISGGGMCEGGRVVEHLEHLLPSERAVILITGYMAPATLGGQLAEIEKCRSEGTTPTFLELQVNGKIFKLDEIKAKIVNLGGYYSGHADKKGLLQFIFTNHRNNVEDDEKTSTIFINHGSKDSRSALKHEIEQHVSLPGQRKIKKVELADSAKWYDLDRRTWLEAELVEHMPSENLLGLLIQEQQKTNALLEKLIGIISMGK